MECDWIECSTGGGEVIKGIRMEVPPPFVNLQASRGAKRRSTAWQEEPGGGWRCAGALGEFLESESFHSDGSIFNHL